MNKAIITIVTVLLVIGVANVQAEIIWDSGHHIYSEGEETWVYMYNDASAEIIGGTIYEFDMYNNTTADITGGYIGNLLCYDISSVNVYDIGEISLVKPFNSATVNIYGGTITTVLAEDSSDTSIYGASLTEIGARDLSTVNLYTASYELDPTGGTFGNGLLTGTWLYGGSFSIDLVAEETINHLNFIPEPSTLSLFVLGLGAVLARIC